MQQFLVPLRPESDKMLHLDSLRLIGSVGVILHHLYDFIDPGSWSGILLRITQPFSLFVDMFFAVSGFVIAFIYFERLDDLRSYGTFLRKRIARLVPLHWATLSVFVLIGVALSSSGVLVRHTEPYEWRCLPGSILLLQSTGLLCPHLSFNSASWSISAEVIMYLAAPVIFWAMRRNATAFGVMFACLLIGLTVATDGTDAWFFWTTPGGPIRALPSFLFGAWLFSVRHRLYAWRLIGAFFWPSIVAFLAGCMLGLPPVALLLTLYVSVTAGVVSDFNPTRSLIVRALAAGGQLTYSSYMLHTLVITIVLSGVSDGILHTHGLARNLMAMLAFAAIWPLSYLSLVLFERPARRFVVGGR